MNIAVAGTGYVGLSLAVLLSQHNRVTAVDIVEEKVNLINNWKSPIQDEYIEKYLTEHEKRGLDLRATTDGKSAYRDADYVIIAAPTNYDPQKNFFDCSAVESVISLVLESSDTAIMVIKSTIPVGYTKKVRERFQTDRILFSPEFLRESKALYDNRYPSRIIVGTDERTRETADAFAVLLKDGTEELVRAIVKSNRTRKDFIADRVFGKGRVLHGELNMESQKRKVNHGWSLSPHYEGEQ